MSQRFKTKKAGKRPENAKRVMALRKKWGMSQREFAEEFNVSGSMVAHWESGERELQGPALKLLEIYEKKQRNN